MIRCDYLIVGAGIGGVSVCEGIREHDAKGSIMLVGAEHELPYHRPQLFPQILAKGKISPDKLHPHDADWFKKKKIDLRLGTIVTQFNLERHLAVLANGQAVEFKKACLATGCRARRPQVAGANLGNVFYLRSLRDLLGLQEILGSEKEIVIVGGGLVACEVAAHLSHRPKIRISLMHRGKGLLGRFLDEETSIWLAERFAKEGVKMLLGETLNGFEGRTVLRNVQTKSGQRYSAQVAICAVGADMNNGLFLNTPLNYPAGTPVNDYLETEEKGVYAIGDIALFPDRIFGGQRRIEHWQNAIDQGHLAGANMTGRKRLKWECTPHVATTLFDLHFDFVGDYTRPPTRVEITGDRKKGKFIARHYHLATLLAVTLCNEKPEKVEAAKTEVKETPREVKRYD
jgi:3-phenylpropionate/trans-cinnamate dioxygenase ferredoxin reductase component